MLNDTDIDQLHKVAEYVRLGHNLPRRMGKSTYILHCVCGYAQLGFDVDIITRYNSTYLIQMLDDIAKEYGLKLRRYRTKYSFSIDNQFITFHMSDGSPKSNEMVDRKLRGRNREFVVLRD